MKGQLHFPRIRRVALPLVEVADAVRLKGHCHDKAHVWS